MKTVSLPYRPTRSSATIPARCVAAAALADFRGPVFILEAGRDTVVPGASTQRLVEALPRAPTRLRVAGADHDSALGTPAEVEALKDFASVALAEAD